MLVHYLLSNRFTLLNYFVYLRLDMEKLETIVKTLCDYSQIMTFENNVLFALSTEIADIKQNALSKMPLHINVIAISAIGKLKETAHSSILQHLLKDPRILDSFIENIMELKGYEVTAKDVNPAEQNRMDVSIFSKEICIIIENKVNGANEQLGQIFRYVQKAKDRGYSDDQIKVLYLNPDNYVMPSDYSLTEYGEGKVSIPTIISDNIIVKNYAQDIYEWIKEIYRIIPETELFIKSALHQYQDYLEEHFQLTNKFTLMKESIRTAINNNLLIGLSDENDADFSQRIAKLEEALDNLINLQTGVSEMIKSLRYEKVVKWITNELQHKLINLAPFGYSEYEYGVEVSINGKIGYLGFGYNHSNHNAKPYIGFAFNNASLTDDERQYLIGVFERFGKSNSGTEEKWPCWDRVIEADLIKEFLDFVKFVKCNELHQIHLS